MSIQKFLDVSNLKANPRAEMMLESLRRVMGPELEDIRRQLDHRLDNMVAFCPELKEVVALIRPMFWEAGTLPDCVYRRITALLNLIRSKKMPIRFNPLAHSILAQVPRDDAPEQTAFLAFFRRIFELWNYLRHGQYYSEDEEACFALDMLLPLRPLHPGANAMNANYLPGKRHAMHAEEVRTLYMQGEGQKAQYVVDIRPAGAGATRISSHNRHVLLTDEKPCAVVGRELGFSDLFRLEIVDRSGQSQTMNYPVQLEVPDAMYSRAALRITRLVEDNGQVQICITENGALYDVNLGDRVYSPSPDPTSGLSGITLFNGIIPYNMHDIIDHVSTHADEPSELE